MSEDQFISFDLRCSECSYNLRGLPVGNRCPECGHPAPANVATREDWIHWRNRQAFGPTAEAIGCTLDALMFVVDSFRRAKMSAPRTILMGISPITADDLCRAVRDQAQDYFKDEAEAIELLAEWGIRTSEDVGKIVFGLVKRGILIPTGTDRIEDFAGKFSLSDLFSRPI